MSKKFLLFYDDAKNRLLSFFPLENIAEKMQIIRFEIVDVLEP